VFYAFALFVFLFKFINMRLAFSILVAFISLQMPLAGVAAILPAEGAVLHYRLVGFSFPADEMATSYRLEIFDSSINSLPIVTKEANSNKIIAVVPEFGKKYAWRIKYLKKKKVIATGEPHYFSVNANPFSGKTVSRVVVVDSASKYRDMLLFFDNTRSLYNMDGEPLWYLPVIPGITDTGAGIIRDIKLTSTGTITFLTTKNVYEMDYYGNITWSGPKEGNINGNELEQYHHDFTRLSNGNYMTIRNQLVIAKGNELAADTAKDKGKVKTPCGTIIEYSPQKEVVWSWNSCDYVGAGDQTSHFNAIYFDEKRKAVYSSYRNLSKVLKAEYPSGRVLAQYGNGMFYYQHNCNMNSDGDFILFNNNFNSFLPQAERSNTIPVVTVFKEPQHPGDSLQKIWAFKTDIDTLVKPMSSGGGSVRELDKGDYLVCTGLPGRNFIVSKDKKVLWNVLVEQFEGNWKPFQGYRISPVQTQDLDKLLFR
jgi:hypothetical protein